MSVRRIAEALALSPSTISLALRNSPKIPRATRDRVVREAQRFGYRPSAKVRELMAQLRLCGNQSNQACLGVISFYDTPRPWERSLHLTRIYENMSRRAEELGYRIEPIWLRAPGMSMRRFCSILDARGIQGLLCFGSPNLGEELPAEFDHYAIVTVGLSIKTHVHRVTSHAFNDMTATLSRVRDMGYRRPGLVLGVYEDDRSAHAYTSAYFGWCEHVLGSPDSVPVLRLHDIEERLLLGWLEQHRPDAMIFVHLYDVVGGLMRTLQGNGIRVPEDLGVAAISQILDGTGLAGFQQNQTLMGAWAVELLVSRIMSQDFGIPLHPRIEMVESEWVDGASLRAAATGIKDQGTAVRRRVGSFPRRHLLEPSLTSKVA